MSLCWGWGCISIVGVLVHCTPPFHPDRSRSGAIDLPTRRSTHLRLLTIWLHSQLITQEQHLHIAAADGAPGFDELVYDITDKFGADDVPPKAIIMDDHNNDWDTLYPFSAVRTSCLCFSSWLLTPNFVMYSKPIACATQFLSPFKINLPLDPAYVAPWPPEEWFSVTAVNDTIDEQAGTRKLALRIDHPGIIWTGEARVRSQPGTH